MTPDQKKAIHDYATQAALDGIPTSHACPYPPNTPAWFEFQAAYRMAGAKCMEMKYV